ncbi:MAG: hypothetical protein ACIAS6_12960 [Phycisphaerales bacterium JB060]
MRRILFVSEFASDADWHFQQLAPALARLPEPIECVPVRGISANRTGGGLSPRRIWNGASVYAKLPFALMRQHPQAIFCITTPPGIQLWCTLLGRLTRTPVICWMMDYHPEIEARLIQASKVGRSLARVLRWLDRRSLRRCHGIITLDEAMASICRDRAPRANVETFPPWPESKLQGLDPAAEPGPDGPLHLLHVGSLGRAHDPAVLGQLLHTVPDRCRLTLLGADDRTQRAFRELAEKSPVDLSISGHLPSHEFARTLRESGAHYGIVLLRDLYAGLVSPSKFTAYVAASIPLLYIGPPGTTAHALCIDHSAGVVLTNQAGQAEFIAAAEQLLDPQARMKTRVGMRDARRWLAQHDAAAFSRLIASMLPPEKT